MMPHDPAADKTPSLDACLDGLRAFVLEAARGGATFHDFEQGLWQQVLAAGRAATAEFLQRQGPGDLGETLTLPDGQDVRRLPEEHTRDLTGVFGTFHLSRVCYGSREGQQIAFVPLDNRLALPAGKFSYLLQDFDGLLATEEAFAKVSATLERILHLEQHVDSLQRQAQHMAEFVEPYRAAQPPPPAREEGPILVRSADGKGVPMRAAADAPPIRSHDHKRGPKTGRKKQAILGAVYTVKPLVRTPQEVVELLFCPPARPAARGDRPERPELCHKRVMARLNEYTDRAGAQHDGLAEVFAWMAGQVAARNPEGDKEVVNLYDGDERFPQEQKASGGPDGVQVLDLLHVTPKLWSAAGLFAARSSPEAEGQVRDWVLAVLQGEAAQVVEQIRARGAAAALSANQRKELAEVCNYLGKRLGQMKYDEYLAKGYPIASGVIEGACRHYVKDRMEGTGMSWKQRGAQAVLELRSRALNGEWDDFQDFYRQREAEGLYPHRSLLEDISWPLAA